MDREIYTLAIYLSLVNKEGARWKQPYNLTLRRIVTALFYPPRTEYVKQFIMTQVLC